MKVLHKRLLTFTLLASLIGCSSPPDKAPVLGDKKLEQAQQDLVNSQQLLNQRTQELTQLRQENQTLRDDLKFICSKAFPALQARRAFDIDLEQRWSSTCGSPNPGTVPNPSATVTPEPTVTPDVTAPPSVTVTPTPNSNAPATP